MQTYLPTYVGSYSRVVCVCNLTRKGKGKGTYEAEDMSLENV